MSEREPPRLEELECRLAPANLWLSWDGSVSSNWKNPENWTDLDTLATPLARPDGPLSDDRVVVTSLGARPVIGEAFEAHDFELLMGADGDKLTLEADLLLKPGSGQSIDVKRGTVEFAQSAELTFDTGQERLATIGNAVNRVTFQNAASGNGRVVVLGAGTTALDADETDGVVFGVPVEVGTSEPGSPPAPYGVLGMLDAAENGSTVVFNETVVVNETGRMVANYDVNGRAGWSWRTSNDAEILCTGAVAIGGNSTAFDGDFVTELPIWVYDGGSLSVSPEDAFTIDGDTDLVNRGGGPYTLRVDDSDSRVTLGALSDLTLTTDDGYVEEGTLDSWGSVLLKAGHWRFGVGADVLLGAASGTGKTTFDADLDSAQTGGAGSARPTIHSELAGALAASRSWVEVTSGHKMTGYWDLDFTVTAPAPAASTVWRVIDQKGLLDGEPVFVNKTFGGPGVTGTNGSWGVLVNASDVDAYYDLGDAQVGGKLWADADQDGVQEDADDGALDDALAGYAGVEVRLYDGTNTQLDTAWTDSSGNYGFTGLSIGSYRVKIDIDDEVYYYLSAADQTADDLDSDFSGIGRYPGSPTEFLAPGGLLDFDAGLLEA